MPDKIIGLTLFLDFIDRCPALSSLYPPLAAVASLTPVSFADSPLKEGATVRSTIYNCSINRNLQNKWGGEFLLKNNLEKWLLFIHNPCGKKLVISGKMC